jgi:hypothetical protein
MAARRGGGLDPPVHYNYSRVWIGLKLDAYTFWDRGNRRKGEKVGEKVKENVGEKVVRILPNHLEKRLNLLDSCCAACYYKLL